MKWRERSELGEMEEDEGSRERREIMKGWGLWRGKY